MKKIYMIGNTHFDPVWLWKWDEAMSSITATFRSALDRMNEYPEFKYSFCTPPVFEWIKKTSPEMFEEIKQRVKEGRWELAEGWWVQPDCFSALGESYVRQGLYGQKYLKENFGKYTNTVFNIDSFGHPSTLPQILSKSGIKYYVFCRPENKHINFDVPFFNWISEDESSVTTFRDDAPYMRDTAERIEEAEKLDYDSILVYGVTDHGGAPTKKAIEQIRNSKTANCATVEEFFADCSTNNTYEGELVTADFGVYANNPSIKALNRTAEYALLNAEKATVISGKSESEILKKCWQDVMFNQFHDILGGASIKDAYFDAENLYGRAISTANEIMHFNLLKVTNSIKMPGKNPDNVWNIVVWNLNPYEYNGYIEAETQWVHEFPWYDKEIVLEDSDGKRYECQIIREKSVIPAFRSRFLFKAKIDSMGYKAFKVVQTGEDIPVCDFEDTKRIETEKYIINISESGQIESVFSKEKSENICGKLLYPAVFEDDGDTWAFNIDSYGKECEPFKLSKLEVTEKGGFRNIIKATYTFRSSKLEIYYAIYNNEDYVDVTYKINWNEKHLCVKLLSDFENCEHKVSIPYGSINRNANPADVPMGEWLECENLSFAVKGIFAYNFNDKKLGFTVLRSPIYGDLRIEDIDLDTDYDIISQGITEGSIRVFFEKEVPIQKSATHFNNPPVVLCESNHNGTLDSKGTFCNLSSKSAVITAVKYSEEDNGIIVRGMEYNGVEQTVTLEVHNNAYIFKISPFEIFTVKIKDEKLCKVNMLEDLCDC